MFSVELSTREWDGHVVVALDGELDLVDAADVAAALVTVTAPQQPVLRVLAITRLTDNFSVHASAARNTAKSDPATVLPFPGCGDDG